MEKISLPVRIFAVVIVLVGLAGMLALRTLGPSGEVSTEPVAQLKPAAVAAPAPAKAKAKPSVSETQGAPAPTPTPVAQPAPVNAVEQDLPESGFPPVVDRALAKHEVVVLSLVVPGARVDALAAAEAQAGAKLGGAGFLALNVLNERVARSLLTKLENVQDPSVVVVTRSGDIALELAGFVDRETVAQAAANASS